MPILTKKTATKTSTKKSPKTKKMTYSKIQLGVLKGKIKVSKDAFDEDNEKTLSY